MEPLYEHQKKIIQEDKKRTGIFQGTGSGKTRSALELARGSTLVVCPKQQKLDKTWERNSIKFGIVLDLTVISKEKFKKEWDTLPYYDVPNNSTICEITVGDGLIGYTENGLLTENDENLLTEDNNILLY